MPDRPSLRILILQLCRMGDILQTTPMLRGLRREQPDADITLVVHDTFRDVPVPSRLYDRKLAFPHSRIAARLADAPEDWAAPTTIAREFVESLGAEPYDVTINLTHSDLCGFIAGTVPSRRVEGGAISPERVRVVRGPWMTWFWSSQVSREQGCFNLVDLHNWAAGVTSDRQSLEIDVSDTARAAIDAWLDARGIGNRPLLAVQLGASEERKRWQPERFAQAINLLPAELGEIVFVGASSERALFERAQAALTRPVHDAVGATSMPELAALMERTRLLLTNDTGTMHIASACGTKIVDVSTGPVFVHETGPYGEGHFVIEPRSECFPCAAGSQCHHISCRDAFTPADIAALVRHAAGDGDVPRPAGARISRGFFTPSGRIEYRPVWAAGQDRAEIVRRAAAVMWEQTMPVPGVGACSMARAVSREVPHRSRAIRLADSEETSTLHGLRTLAAQAASAARLATRLSMAGPQGQGALGRDIEEALRQVQLTAQLHPVCQPIEAYLRVTIESTLERDVVKLARVYAQECAAAARRSELLASLLDGRSSAARQADANVA